MSASAPSGECRIYRSLPAARDRFDVSAARRSAPCMLLRDGRVLVVGGSDNGTHKKGHGGGSPMSRSVRSAERVI